MDDYKLKVLKYYYDNGAVDLNTLDNHFSYDFSPEQFNDTLNYLIGKKYLSNNHPNGVVYELSDLGRHTIIDVIKQTQIINQKLAFRENLEVENLSLQNDSIKYQNSIREKQSKIDRLTIENISLQNRQLKRYVLYSIISFVIGAIVSNMKEIWVFVQGQIP